MTGHSLCWFNRPGQLRSHLTYNSYLVSEGEINVRGPQLKSYRIYEVRGDVRAGQEPKKTLDEDKMAGGRSQMKPPENHWRGYMLREKHNEGDSVFLCLIPSSNLFPFWFGRCSSGLQSNLMNFDFNRHFRSKHYFERINNTQPE